MTITKIELRDLTAPGPPPCDVAVGFGVRVLVSAVVVVDIGATFYLTPRSFALLPWRTCKDHSAP